MSIQELCEVSIYGKPTFIRLDNKAVEASNQPAELERIIHLLTGESFINSPESKYKRQLENSRNFEILKPFSNSGDIPTYHLNCLCGESTCKTLFQTLHIPSKTYFGIGSVCLYRFNEDNSKEIYDMTKRNKCIDCDCSLVLKSSSNFKKNTNKYLNGRCEYCNNKFLKTKAIRYGELYLNVSYDEKDNAKHLGAKWNDKNKSWYVMIFDENRDKLIYTYGLKEINNEVDKAVIEKKVKNDRIYLKVSFDEKDNAKRLGALWDVEKNFGIVGVIIQIRIN